MTKHCNDAKKKAQATAQALVDLSNKEAEEKKRADVVLFEIAGANGLVCRCHIPTAAVAQRGLFRILLGGSMITDSTNKDVVPFSTSRIPTVAVAQRGLFRRLLGGYMVTNHQ